MAALTLKSVPETLMERLRLRAQRDRRSLTQEAIVLLDRALAEAPPSPSEKVAEQVAAWRRCAGKWSSTESVAAEVAGIYKARTLGRERKR